MTATQRVLGVHSDFMNGRSTPGSRKTSSLIRWPACRGRPCRRSRRWCVSTTMRIARCLAGRLRSSLVGQVVDDVGVATSASSCRSWRSAAGPAPGQPSSSVSSRQSSQHQAPVVEEGPLQRRAGGGGRSLRVGPPPVAGPGLCSRAWWGVQRRSSGEGRREGRVRGLRAGQVGVCRASWRGPDGARRPARGRHAGSGPPGGGLQPERLVRPSSVLSSSSPVWVSSASVKPFAPFGGGAEGRLARRRLSRLQLAPSSVLRTEGATAQPVGHQAARARGQQPEEAALA